MFADRVVFVGLCGLAIAAAYPAAQQTTPPGPATPAPTFRAASRDLVVLPVTLRDRSDKLVGGLSVDRFVVYDEDRRQPIALFSNEDVPVSVAVVIDNSGSMGRRMSEVLAATIHFARSSHPEDQIFVIEFNDRVRDALGGRPVTADDTPELERALRTLVPQGRTALYDGLHTGMDRLERSSLSRRILLLISDGGDNASGSDLKSVVERARASNVSIYPFGVFDPDDPDANEGVLKTLANETGGERFLPRSAGPLLQAIEQVAREIRSGYTIAFEPPARDGRYHRVRVEVIGANSRDYKLRTRPGYVAGSR
jgi:Ca-activated chloride channel family protein